MSFTPGDYLRHILVETEYPIQASAHLTLAEFLGDETLRRAFVRSLEIVGEASKKVPTELRSRYPEVEWSSMGRMRDRLIHGYFGVDYELVWDVAVRKVPEPRVQIELILKAESDV